MLGSAADCFHSSIGAMRLKLKIVDKRVIRMAEQSWLQGVGARGCSSILLLGSVSVIMSLNKFTNFPFRGKGMGIRHLRSSLVAVGSVGMPFLGSQHCPWGCSALGLAWALQPAWRIQQRAAVPGASWTHTAVLLTAPSPRESRALSW